MHILILGGTSESAALVRLLETRRDIRATLSLAGRTSQPALPAIDYRIGGFGGVEGLSEWIREHKVTALVDATHPFARHMPTHAARASAQTAIPMLSLLRSPWKPSEGDRWTEVADHDAAIGILGSTPQRIFLTVGRLELGDYAKAPQHFYLARSIDPVEPKPLPNAHWLTARGPFSIESEAELLRDYRIDTLITKNSGGEATAAKLHAARQLELPVLLIARPPRPEGLRVETAPKALDWIARVHKLSL